jgi:ferredoxin--NADP+ reductase
MAEENATLVEKIELAPTLAIFRIHPDVAPPPGTAWFLPGQYVTIGAEKIQRAYSIASDPEDRRWLEFYIRFAREPATVSPLTHLLWALPIGARLHIGEKIAGRFTLERTAAGDARDRLMVAAGTGLAPFVSMVRRAERAGDAAALSRFAVLHGVSHPHELAYRDELAAAQERFGLRYRPTVSRPREHPEWTGLTGRVESLLSDGKLVGIELSPDRSLVYVCGFRPAAAAPGVHPGGPQAAADAGHPRRRQALALLRAVRPGSRVRSQRPAADRVAPGGARVAAVSGHHLFSARLPGYRLAEK